MNDPCAGIGCGRGQACSDGALRGRPVHRHRLPGRAVPGRPVLRHRQRRRRPGLARDQRLRLHHRRPGHAAGPAGPAGAGPAGPPPAPARLPRARRCSACCCCCRGDLRLQEDGPLRPGHLHRARRRPHGLRGGGPLRRPGPRPVPLRQLRSLLPGRRDLRRPGLRAVHQRGPPGHRGLAGDHAPGRHHPGQARPLRPALRRRRHRPGHAPRRHHHLRRQRPRRRAPLHPHRPEGRAAGHLADPGGQPGPGHLQLEGRAGGGPRPRPSAGWRPAPPRSGPSPWST